MIMGEAACLPCRDQAHLAELLSAMHTAGVEITCLSRSRDDGVDFKFRRDKGLVLGSLEIWKDYDRWFFTLECGHKLNAFRWRADEQLSLDLQRLFAEHGAPRGTLDEVLGSPRGAQTIHPLPPS
jgi:hypothetical protein